MTPDLTQLGFGLGSLALIWVVVQYFIKTIEKKDTQISVMVNAFNKTINNHMVHETKAFNNLAKVIDKLGKEIKKKKQ